MPFSQQYNAKDLNVLNSSGSVNEVHLGSETNDTSKKVEVKDIQNSFLGQAANISGSKENIPKFPSQCSLEHWKCIGCSVSSRYLCLECLKPLCAVCTPKHETHYHMINEQNSAEDDNESESSSMSSDS